MISTRGYEKSVGNEVVRENAATQGTHESFGESLKRFSAKKQHKDSRVSKLGTNPARRGAMAFSDPHARSKPTVLHRPRELPADIMHAREVEWLGELQARLAAVEAWRGLYAHRRSGANNTVEVRPQILD